MNEIKPVVGEAARELTAQILTVVSQAYSAAAIVSSKIPGSDLFYRYCVSSYQNDPFRLFLEVLLIIFMIWYFVAKRYSPSSNEVILTEKEIQELIDEWEPEPLVNPLTDWEKEELERKPVLSGQVGLKTKTQDGKERLNFASFNFLGIMNSENVKEKAIKALRTYGVGTCGPR
jgi:serine palmitoyltransferase